MGIFVVLDGADVAYISVNDVKMFPKTFARSGPIYERITTDDRGNVAIQTKAVAFAPDKAEVTPHLRTPVTSAQDRLANMQERFAKLAELYHGQGRQDRAHLNLFIANVIRGAIENHLPMTAVELGYAELGRRSRIDDIESGPKALQHAIFGVLHEAGDERENLLTRHANHGGMSSHAWDLFVAHNGERRFRDAVGKMQANTFSSSESFDTLLPKSALRTRAVSGQLSSAYLFEHAAQALAPFAATMTRSVTSFPTQGWDHNVLVKQARGTRDDQLLHFVASHHARAEHAVQEGDSERADVHRAIANVLEGAVRGRFASRNHASEKIFENISESRKVRWHLALLERAVVKVFREHPSAMHVGGQPGRDHIVAWPSFLAAGGEDAYRALAHEHEQEVEARKCVVAALAAPMGGALCAVPWFAACCALDPFMALVTVEVPIYGAIAAGVGSFHAASALTERYASFSLVDTRPNIDAVVAERRAGTELAQISSEGINRN